jgi:multicomponent Na+:H+ antiporter subunit F
MNLLLIPMVLVLLIPFYTAYKQEDIWQKMLALASITTKTSILVLFISVLRDDWMIGVVAVIILSVGNAGFMLLAQILKRIHDVTTEPRSPYA